MYGHQAKSFHNFTIMLTNAMFIIVLSAVILVVFVSASKKYVLYEL